MHIFSKISHLYLVFCYTLIWFSSTSVFADTKIKTDLLPPGDLIDVGGYKLHIYCKGDVTSRPTVILDSGVGGFSLEWIRIQETIAEQDRICAYDRAGYGWSDMGPLPRTTKRITTELHTLLENAGITGPYIFVGHSFGGYTAQYYARNYQDEIIAMLLIDSSHPEQFYRFPTRKSTHTHKSVDRSKTRYRIQQPTLSNNYPLEVVDIAYHLMSSWKSTLTLQEERSSFYISGLQIDASDPMPDIPLIVLTRGQRVWPKDEYGDAMEKTWLQLQEELTSISSKTEHIIAKNSGHLIHLDQPGIVIKAVRNLLHKNENEETQKLIECSQPESVTVNC